MSSSTGEIETVDSYRKIMRDFMETWFTGTRLTIIAAISFMLLFVLGLTDYLSVNTLSPVIVEKSSDGEFLQIDFNLSFPEVRCKFASVDVRDAFGMNMLNITKTLRKYSIDSTTQEIVEEIAEGSLKLNAGNFHRVLKQHPLAVVKFYAPWCYWSKRLEPTWEEAARNISGRYDTEAGEGILVGEVDCTVEKYLCRRYEIQGYPSIRIFRNGSDLVRMRINGNESSSKHESYYGDRDTDSLVKMMEDLVAPISVQSADRTSERPAGTKRGCRIEGSVHGKKASRNLIASARSATDGSRVYIALKTIAGRKFMGY